MTPYINHPRVMRLNEVFEELNYRSYNSFAVDVDSSQPVVSNYLQGKRIPTTDFMRVVNKRFPQYNLQWLLDGEGEKYNSDTVVFGPNNQTKSNSNIGDFINGNEIGDPNLYERLFESMNERIKILEQFNEHLLKENDMLRTLIDKI